MPLHCRAHEIRPCHHGTDGGDPAIVLVCGVLLLPMVVLYVRLHRGSAPGLQLCGVCERRILPALHRIRNESLGIVGGDGLYAPGLPGHKSLVQGDCHYPVSVYAGADCHGHCEIGDVH